MKILICVNHPAHVHLFKNFIWRMQEKGHTFNIVARDKESTIDLLEKFGFSYILISKAETTPIGFAREAIKRAWKIRSIIRESRSELVLSQMDPSPAIAAKIMGVPYVCLADSEPAKLILRSTVPLSRAVLTPSSFRMNLGWRQINYRGYKELAYLHPNVFKPDISVLKEIGLSINDPYFILRFVSWSAHHDVGEKGIQNKFEIVNRLEKFGHVFISSESQLNGGLKQYKLDISPEKMHDVLFYANLLFCDSQTMATEAAILGTPVVRCNSFAGGGDMGNFIELEKKYNLIYNFNDEKKAIDCAESLLKKPNLKQEWVEKKNVLISDKIDVTSFMIWLIENYPNSISEIMDIPGVQNNFR